MKNPYCTFLARTKFPSENELLSIKQYVSGAKWHQRRKVLTPTFHFNILRHFNVILEENSRKLVEQLSTEVGKDKTNVANYITEFTLHSICGKLTLNYSVYLQFA